MKREPEGAPGNEDNDTWLPIATHGQSEEVVLAAIDRYNDSILDDNVRAWRADGMSEPEIAEHCQDWLKNARRQARHDVPNIMRNMALTAGDTVVH